MDYFKVYLQEVGWGVDVPEIFQQEQGKTGQNKKEACLYAV